VDWINLVQGRDKWKDENAALRILLESLKSSGHYMYRLLILDIPVCYSNSKN
jgi:hypothetical protein